MGRLRRKRSAASATLAGAKPDANSRTSGSAPIHPASTTTPATPRDQPGHQPGQSPGFGIRPAARFGGQGGQEGGDQAADQGHLLHQQRQKRTGEKGVGDIRGAEPGGDGDIPYVA